MGFLSDLKKWATIVPEPKEVEEPAHPFEPYMEETQEYVHSLVENLRVPVVKVAGIIFRPGEFCAYARDGVGYYSTRTERTGMRMGTRLGKFGRMPLYVGGWHSAPVGVVDILEISLCVTNHRILFSGQKSGSIPWDSVIKISPVDYGKSSAKGQDLEEAPWLAFGIHGLEVDTSKSSTPHIFVNLPNPILVHQIMMFLCAQRLKTPEITKEMVHIVQVDGSGQEGP